MKGGGRTDGPARVRHWWNGKVIQSRVDSGVRSTNATPAKQTRQATSDKRDKICSDKIANSRLLSNIQVCAVTFTLHTVR